MIKIEAEEELKRVLERERRLNEPRGKGKKALHRVIALNEELVTIAEKRENKH